MKLDLRTLNAAEANAEKLLNLLKAIRIYGEHELYLKPKLTSARRISELLDEQIYITYYDKIKRNKE